MGDDELFQVKNFFYLGNYQMAINEASQGSFSPGSKTELDCLINRSYLGMGNFQLVVGEISDSDAMDLQAVRLLANYLTPGMREGALEQLSALMEDSSASGNPTFQLMAGYIYSYEQEYENALRVVHNGYTLEQIALHIQILLKIDRVDVAERELKNMYKMDEDATLTQLTTAWVHMALGGDKLQEAYYILQELAEKFGQTVQLLNGLAVYQMLAGKYEEAERLLNDALGKNNNDADTLANLVACSPHTGKSPELVKRYESQLTATSPHHGWVANMTAMSASFDRACESM